MRRFGIIRIFATIGLLGALSCSEENVDNPGDPGENDSSAVATPEGNAFLIAAKHSGKCLDVADLSTADGGRIQQWACTSGDNQAWRLKSVGDHIQIQSVHSGKCLDVKDFSKADGAPLQQYACTGADNQLFRLEADSGAYRFIAKHSGKAVDIADRSTSDGGLVQQWSPSGGSNQSFTLQAIGTSSFVHARGTKIVDERGNELFLKGINLGNWLVWEGYLMMGDFNYRTHTQFFNSLSAAFGSSDRAAEFENQWRLNYVDDGAIAELKRLGFNTVRVPFNHNLFWWDNRLRDNGFVYFDRLISSCRTHGMHVLLDMHGAPGYQNPGDHSDNVNSNSSQPRGSVTLWDGNNVKIASDIWRHIAGRYKDEPVVLGYDLINEPVPQPGREYELLPSLVTMRNAIREVDANHIIVAEGSWWASDLSKIDWEDATVRSRSGVSSKWDQNLVYQIHHYGAAADTFGRENVTNRLNIPLIIGEFGESDDANLRKINDWAKKSLAGSFPWSFKKMSHDKALWTITPDQSYEQVKAFINNGGSPPTHLYDAMINFAKTNVRNGHPSLIWHQSFYDAVNPN